MATPQWLQVLGSWPETIPGSSDQYTDPATGWRYRAVFSGGMMTEAFGQIQGQRVGYVGMDGKPWYKGQLGYIYDLNGAQTQVFEITDFAANDALDKLAMVVVGVIVAGAAAYAAGLAVPGTSAATGAAATAGGGSAIPLGTAAATTATGAGFSIGGAATTLGKVIATVGAALSLTGPGGGSGGSQPGGGSGGSQPGGGSGGSQPGASQPGGINPLLLAAAAAGAYFLLG